MIRISELCKRFRWIFSVLTNIRTTTPYLRGLPCNRPIHTTDCDDVSEEPDFLELLFTSDDEKRGGGSG